MKIIQKLTIISLVLAFIIQAPTAIIKLLELYNIYNFDYELISRYTINTLHDLSGIALIVLIIIHLILKNQYFLSPTVLAKKFLGVRIKIWYLFIVLIIIGLIIALYVNKLNLASNKVKELAKSEITEYQGEKLDSIIDLQNTGIKGTQYIDKENYSLEITGLVENSKNYSYDQVLELPKYSKVVELNCVVGWRATILWEGIKLIELLEKSKL